MKQERGDSRQEEEEKAPLPKARTGRQQQHKRQNGPVEPVVDPPAVDGTDRGRPQHDQQRTGGRIQSRRQIHSGTLQTLQHKNVPPGRQGVSGLSARHRQPAGQRTNRLPLGPKALSGHKKTRPVSRLLRQASVVVACITTPASTTTDRIARRPHCWRPIARCSQHAQRLAIHHKRNLHRPSHPVRRRQPSSKITPLGNILRSPVHHKRSHRPPFPTLPASALDRPLKLEVLRQVQTLIKAAYTSHSLRLNIGKFENCCQ